MAVGPARRENGEEKPLCLNCHKQGEVCDYSIRLNWEGRSRRKDEGKPERQPRTFSGQPLATEQSAQSSSREGTNSRPRSSVSSASKPPTQNVISPYQPSFRQPSDRPEPLPPFSDNDLLNSPSRPASFGSDGQSNSQPNELMSRFLEASQSIARLTQGRHPHHATPSPSPKQFVFDPAKHGLVATTSATNSTERLPPYWPPDSSIQTEYDASPERCAKRIRLSAGDVVPQNAEINHPHGASSCDSGEFDELPQPPTPNLVSPYVTNPMTPAASSTNSEEMRQSWRLGSNPYALQDPEVRRVSVNSLLTGSSGLDRQQKMVANYTQSYHGLGAISPLLDYSSPSRQGANSSPRTEAYGHDHGLPDLDIPRNDDAGATNGQSAAQQSELHTWPQTIEPGVFEFGFGLPKRECVFARGGYYASPVPIKISRKLEPLPSTLLENPMNLMYFHHFLNHTARILVVHDCSRNPFRTLLPQMAIHNRNILHLLLAYSASHRARLLNQPEPANRIAHWVQDVFPSLRHALDHADSSTVEVSDTNLATAIMLTSLEIISPSAFGVSVPWQNHLNIARRIIRNRGGLPHPVARRDAVPHFLHLWLAYIDVFGSLSSHTLEEEPFHATLEGLHENTSTLSDEDDYTIECMLGFTSRCVTILAQIAKRARWCSYPRGEAAKRQLIRNWQATVDFQVDCDRLQAELERSRVHLVKHCPHHGHEEGSMDGNSFTSPEDNVALQELVATNDAFHRAAQIHLLRRVRNLPQGALEVQNSIQEIVNALSKVRPGGSAEACLLFPMFTAGVEAEDELTRRLILERVKRLEGMGMMQVGRARNLMEKVWETGQEWETLAQGEFFG